MARKISLYTLEEPLDGVKTARVVIDVSDGNLLIDRLDGGQALVRGDLQFLEGQNPPIHSVERNGDQALLSLRAARSGQTWLWMPWSACNGGLDWQVHLNPTVVEEITARTGGGVIRLDLSDLSVSRIEAETGGGIVEMTLPDRAANLFVTAKTGAGKVTVRIPAGVAARIEAASGMGKVTVDPHFVKIGDTTYQSPDYEGAARKAEIIAGSGAGEVNIISQ